MPNKLSISSDAFKVSILEHVPNPIFAADLDLKITYANLACQKVLGKSLEELLGKSCESMFKTHQCGTVKCPMMRARDANKTVVCRNSILVEGVDTPIEVHATPLRDENGQIVGGLEFILDITERVQFEKKLQDQSDTIRLMSTPTIKLWEGVIVLPVVGVVDSLRAQVMMDSMLERINETNIKVVIIDIHGVAAMDTAVANHLIKMAQATGLMGCDCIISGISSSVAQTIINLGVDMGKIKTKSTLSDALHEAFNKLNIDVVLK